MGRWNNRRWIPRRRYDQESQPSPPNYYQTKVNAQEVLDNGTLSWEQKFCILAGIPWQKIVSQRISFSWNDSTNDNVLKWNDSAGEEAFSNAKKRFWAGLNGLPCDVRVPDLDMFIDKVDWNPEIDSNLISDLDKEYFNPDELDSVPTHTSGQDDKNTDKSGNPWERNCVQNIRDLKDAAQGWNKLGNTLRMNNVHNPWESSDLKGDDGAFKDSTWGSFGGKSWGWNQEPNNIRQSNNLYNKGGDILNRGVQSCRFVMDRSLGYTGNDQNLWNSKGLGNDGNGSYGWNRWETSANESRPVYNGDNSSKIQPVETLETRQRKNCRDNFREWKRWDNQNNEPKYLDSRRPGRGGCRKREDSQEYISRNKSWKCQEKDSGAQHRLWHK